MVWHCMVGAAQEYRMELCRPVSSTVGRQGGSMAAKNPKWPSKSQISALLPTIICIELKKL